ncbi:hypothetical protein DFH06DRAFT_1333473 [Mycena polygramma]|nr:hypothetical protein DFH06DRAFT_1333473 [Mycena polygramma]
MPACDIYSTIPNLGLALTTPHLARKKAFLIGINGPDLEGPREDIVSFRELLSEKFNFQDHDITVMLDDGVSTQPTEANIVRAWYYHSSGDLLTEWRLSKHSWPAKVPGIYSSSSSHREKDAGHAKQKVCLDGSERDGLDEAIILACDDSEAHEKTILDNASFTPLPREAASARLPVSCVLRHLLFRDNVGQDLKHHVCNRPGRLRRAMRRLRELTGIPSARLLAEQTTVPRFCSGYCPRIPSGLKPDVICFSACKDSQRVFEAKGDSMLRTVITLLKKEPNPTLKMLRRDLNKSARHIYRRAKRSNEGGSLKKHAANEGDQGSRADDESDLETLCEVQRWAPQISSTVPLRMDRRLKL